MRIDRTGQHGSACIDGDHIGSILRRPNPGPMNVAVDVKHGPMARGEELPQRLCVLEAMSRCLSGEIWRGADGIMAENDHTITPWDSRQMLTKRFELSLSKLAPSIQLVWASGEKGLNPNFKSDLKISSFSYSLFSAIKFIKLPLPSPLGRS